MELRDQHVVVTGGASGIGRAMCRRFAAEGARAVVVADRDAEGAAAVAKEIGGHAYGLDVTKESELQALIDEAEARDGGIDLFCSNAGILAIGGAECPDEEWERIWQVNVHSHVLAARILVPRMVARGGGYLLNTASAAGLLSQIGSAPYAVTKHAAVGFSEWLAITHGEQGIKVSCLCPQAVRTGMTEGTEGGGVAGVDGMMEPDELVDVVMIGLAEERFLILPHPTVLTYMQRKASDYDRWIGGMQRLQSQFTGGGLS